VVTELEGRRLEGWRDDGRMLGDLGDALYGDLSGRSDFLCEGPEFRDLSGFNSACRRVICARDYWVLSFVLMAVFLRDD